MPDPGRRKPWRQDLLNWYDQNGRDLPWRRTSDPYAIWVSEVMLQQTQVATVLPYYDRWLQRFPTVEALASADDQDVLSAWQGLGYYRRARFLLKGARYVAEQGWPASEEEWRKVPGVGPYTAGALSSIALGLPSALVDGNVERVYARLTGDSAAGAGLHANAWRWAVKNLEKKRAGAWNQALMELGATICRPMQPLCDRCPVRSVCVAYHSDRVSTLPTKTVRVKAKKITHFVCVPVHDGRFGVRQIAAGEWWEGMWEFPRTHDEAELQAIVGPGWQETIGEVRHTVTNHRITINATLQRCEVPTDRLAWHTVEELAALPMPTPQRRVLKLARPYLGTS